MNRSLRLLVLLLGAASAAFLGSKAQATPTGRNLRAPDLYSFCLSSMLLSIAFILLLLLLLLAGAIVKHLSSVLKWTKPSPKTTHHGGSMSFSLRFCRKKSLLSE